MTKTEFAYSLFGYDKVTNGSVSNSLIENYYNDWKMSTLPFNTWRNLLRTRG